MLQVYPVYIYSWMQEILQDHGGETCSPALLKFVGISAAILNTELTTSRHCMFHRFKVPDCFSFRTMDAIEKRAHLQGCEN